MIFHRNRFPSQMLMKSDIGYQSISDADQGHQFFKFIQVFEMGRLQIKASLLYVLKKALDSPAFLVELSQVLSLSCTK